MSLDLPLWSIPLGTLALTSTFFLAKHMNYSAEQWLLGNGLVACGVGLVYGFGFVKEKITWE